MEFEGFKQVDSREFFGSKKPLPKKWARGDGWYIDETEKGYFLNFLTGRLVSRSERFEVKEDEALDLKHDKLTLIDVLKRYDRY